MCGPIKVLLVDDHPFVRLGTSAFLAAADGIELSAEACDGQEAILAADDAKPDVILMDLLMPELDGVAATREILARRPETRILIMTGSGIDDRVEAALRAGAIGYVSKSDPMRHLVDAIRRAFAGEPVLPPPLLRRLLTAPRTPPKVTRRQLEVMSWLGQGFDSHQVARRIGLREASVRSHISRISRKLGLDGRAHLVRSARQALRGEPCGLPADVVRQLRKVAEAPHSTTR